VPALATWTPEDGLLGALAPLGLALASGRPTVVIDLDPRGPEYPGPGSLAELVADDPRRSDLEARRSGIAVVRNGGVDQGAATPVVRAMIDGWPAVVLRLPPRPAPEDPPCPVVPVRLLIPLRWYRPVPGPAVYQATPIPERPPPGAIRLPVPGHSTVAALLRGRAPVAGDRWVRAWRQVWERSWAG